MKTTKPGKLVENIPEGQIIYVTSLTGDKVMVPQASLKKVSSDLAGSPFMHDWLADQIETAFLAGKVFESRTTRYTMRENPVVNDETGQA